MGDYTTFLIKSMQSGGSPHCLMCEGQQLESICHLVASCTALTNERAQIVAEYEQLCAKTIAKLDFSQIKANDETLCQFVLDPISLNLKLRVNINDPLVPEFYKLSREFCFLIDKFRTKSINKNEQKYLQ